MCSFFIYTDECGAGVHGNLMCSEIDTAGVDVQARCKRLAGGSAHLLANANRPTLYKIIDLLLGPREPSKKIENPMTY